MKYPTYDDVLDAVPRVHAVLRPTLLQCWPGLSDLAGCSFYYKHENHQPVGAFKVRGGVNLVGSLDADERRRGILGVSTGNHGQSLAFAARHFGVSCTIVVPENNNPAKNRAIRSLGAELIERGRDFDAAREFAETLIAERGCRYVHSANEPALVAGVGSAMWEVFEELPDPDVVLVPVGLGSGICGAGLVARARRPQTTIIGVQAAEAPAITRSWQAGSARTTERADTWAEGLATRVAAEMTLAMMKELVDDMILVTDDELSRAVYLTMEHTRNLAEGAGAAALAAALRLGSQLRGKKVVGVLTGGNLDMAQLRRFVLGEGQQCDQRPATGDLEAIR